MEGGDAMKIRLEIADDLKEPEIIIRSTEMNEATAQLVSTLSDYLQKDASIPLYKEATVYYLPLKEILFFETEGKEIQAHTLSNCLLYTSYGTDLWVYSK